MTKKPSPIEDNWVCDAWLCGSKNLVLTGLESKVGSVYAGMPNAKLVQLKCGDCGNTSWYRKIL